MNNFLRDHHDQLSNYLIVFGMGGFLIYAILAVTSFVLRYGMQLMAIVKGAGL